MLTDSGVSSNVEQQAKPLYQMVVESVLSQIESGQLQANERLPSESEISRIYSVGRNTVRRAIRELVSANILRTVPGVGTFVVDTRVDKTAEYLFGFTQEMRLHGEIVTSRVLDAKIISADPFLARRLLSGPRCPGWRTFPEAWISLRRLRPSSSTDR